MLQLFSLLLLYHSFLSLTFLTRPLEKRSLKEENQNKKVRFHLGEPVGLAKLLQKSKEHNSVVDCMIFYYFQILFIRL